MLQLGRLFGGLAHLLSYVVLQVRRLLFHIVQSGRQAFHRFEVRRNSLIEFRGNPRQNLLCGRIQRRFNLLRAFSDHLLRSTPDLFLLLC